MEKEVSKTIIILGGNSPKNALWVEKLADFYRAEYSVIVVHYDSWNTNSHLDFQVETAKLITLTDNLEDYTVIAKSAGILLALQAIKHDAIAPSMLIALGTPLKYARYRGVDVISLYWSYPAFRRVVSIQQKNDTEGAAGDIEKILPAHAEIHVIPGNDHQYSDWSMITPYLTKVLQ